MNPPAHAPTKPVRILVTGSRTWTNFDALRAVLTHWRRQHPGAVLVHGGARGADRMAATLWAIWGLPTEAHPADWATHGRAAGPLRNQHMVDLGALVCLAFIREHSRGAEDCAARAEAAGIPTYRIRQEEPR